jgi:hypothetical protein
MKTSPFRQEIPSCEHTSTRISKLFITTIVCMIALAAALSPGTGYSQTPESTTLGGYGELHYNDPEGSPKGSLDFHRLVIYLSHAFDGEISFHSEVELEHTRIEAGEDEGGEIAIEQAYLDWRFAGSTGLKAGIVLIPVGIINERHEPPTFNGVERPNVEKTIIPTTWREAGLGIYGNLAEEVRYQAYLVAGLDATGFSGSGGIRGGRQEGYRSDPVNPSFAGRLDWTADASLRIGTSCFAGNTTGGNAAMGSGTLFLWSGDAEFATGGLTLRGMGTLTFLSDASKINDAMRDGSGALTTMIADRMVGYYLEAAYDIMPHLAPGSPRSLSLFGRFEHYNTQAAVTGFTADPRNNRDEITIGATFRPTYNTAFKVDYQFLNNATDINTRVLNAGLGFFFN